MLVNGEGREATKRKQVVVVERARDSKRKEPSNFALGRGARLLQSRSRRRPPSVVLSAFH